MAILYITKCLVKGGCPEIPVQNVCYAAETTAVLSLPQLRGQIKGSTVWGKIALLDDLKDMMYKCVKAQEKD